MTLEIDESKNFKVHFWVTRGGCFYWPYIEELPKMPPYQVDEVRTLCQSFARDLTRLMFVEVPESDAQR